MITTYDTVRSEHAAFSPTAKDDLKASAAKAKKSSAESDADGSDSEAEHFGRTVAAKKGKTAAKPKPKVCPLFEVKWWRIVLGENRRENKKAVAYWCV